MTEQNDLLQLADNIIRAGDKHLGAGMIRGAIAATSGAARIAELEAENKRMREALEPFADAWNLFASIEAFTRVLSMGQLGRLAAGEVSGIHFKHARAALAHKGD